MNPEAPTRENRRGVRRWLWITPVALLVAALLLANLWLASGFGREWVAGKIQRRARLEAHVGGASVWPWSGVRIYDVEILQPAPLRAATKDPLVRIDSLHLIPVWRAWLRGKRDFRAVELESPRLAVPIELLAELAKSAPQAPAATPPVAAATPPLAPVPSGPPAPVPGPPAPPPPVTPVAPETTPKAPAAILPPTSWLHLKNASFSVFSAASGKAWFEVSGVSGSLPVAGRSAKSLIKVRSIRAGGGDLLSHLSVPLDWTSPQLTLKPLETEIHGLKIQIAAQLGMRDGLPLKFQAGLPRQALPKTALPSNSSAEAESIAANAAFLGFLLAPGTWQGNLITEARSPSGFIAGREVKFDHGSALTVLRGGMLSCIDARLVGDEFSLLGNATLLADGRLAAVLRMVAPPETATAIAGQLFPGIAGPLPLTPLSTPQRAAFDLEALGNIRQFSLQLGQGGPIVELNH